MVDSIDSLDSFEEPLRPFVCGAGIGGSIIAVQAQWKVFFGGTAGKSFPGSG